MYGIEWTQIIKRAEKDIYKLAILTKVSIFIYANSLNTDDLIQTYMCEVSASYTVMNKVAMQEAEIQEVEIQEAEIQEAEIQEIIS